MAKTVNDDISASKIYNSLQSNSITNEIFAEVLADIKDKNGYMRLKQMVMDLISARNTTLVNPDTDKLKRASVINELCMIAFTIDTVLPNVLRMKVQQEFPKLINDILYELKEEKKINNFIPYTKPQIGTGTAEENSSKRSSVSASTSSPNSVKAASSKSPSASENTPVKSPTKQDNVPVKKNSRIKRKRKADTQSVLEDSAEAVQSVSKGSKKFEVVQSVKIEKKDNTEKDQDSEAEILSLLSVSSVHTSELSSFDDAISLSSGDEENGKKKIKLTELKDMYQNDRISTWCAENFQGSKSRRLSQDTEADDGKVTESNELQTKLPIPKTPPKPGRALFWTSTPQKVLPRRIRKPNSKYTSENILTPFAQKQQNRDIYSDLNTIAAESPVLPSQKRIKRESSNEEKITKLHLKNQQDVTSGEKTVMNNVKIENQSSSPNVYKPFTSVRPLTSRRTTAPVTLFSTVSQSSIK